MRSKYLAAEDLPVFDGQEEPQEQARMLQQYLFRLREQLVYILGNLSEENWNKTALENSLNGSELAVSVVALGDSVSQLQLTVGNTVPRLQLTVETLRAEVDSLQTQIRTVSQLQTKVEALRTDVDSLQAQIRNSAQ